MTPAVGRLGGGGTVVLAGCPHNSPMWDMVSLCGTDK